MDRSFLSQKNVVDASRKFVCIRLATYEDAAEAAFMKSLYVGRSGQLENTTFAILAPDGRTKLSATGRAPFHAFRNANDMARGMNRMVAKYAGGNAAPLIGGTLPELANVELGLNVSAADNLPLIVTYAPDPDALDAIHAKLSEVIWQESLAGQFSFVGVLDTTKLSVISGLNLDAGSASAGLVVAEPDQFGLSGKALAQFGANVSTQELTESLEGIVERFPRIHKSHDSHVQLGIQLGIDWESQIPETDIQSIEAKRRMRGQR